MCPDLSKVVAANYKHLEETTRSIYFPIYEELVQKFGANPDDMYFKGASDYLDAWEMAKANKRPLPNEFSPEVERLISQYWRDYFYKGKFGNPIASSLISNDLYKFLITHLSAKVDAYQEKIDSDFHENIKFILLSGHDTTIASFLSGVENPQDLIADIESAFN